MATAAAVAYAASLDDVTAAAERLAGHAHVTPVFTCSALDRLAAGHKLHFKCEVFQKGCVGNIPSATRPACWCNAAAS
jgi:threonine dehydratase